MKRRFGCFFMREDGWAQGIGRVHRTLWGLTSAAGAVGFRLKLCTARHRRTGEGKLKAVLVKHFGEDLGAVNGSRGFERAFREMLWASEASEFLQICPAWTHANPVPVDHS